MDRLYINIICSVMFRWPFVETHSIYNSAVKIVYNYESEQPNRMEERLWKTMKKITETQLF